MTTELEHQSKQTEELLTKNNKLRAQIDTVKRDITIHKEIEKELAKRSHFCQKVIKKLKAKVEDLELQKNNLPKDEPIMQGNPNEPYQAAYQTPDEEMINFLEIKLEQIEK